MRNVTKTVRNNDFSTLILSSVKVIRKSCITELLPIKSQNQNVYLLILTH